MTYASTSIDRRAEYYTRIAELIAADPLDFYTRAEKGRQFMASRLNRYRDPLPRPTPARPARLEVVARRHEPITSSVAQIEMDKPLRGGAIAA